MSFKSEVANRMIFLDEDHWRRVIAEYLEYYHHERNHQGLAGRIIEPEPRSARRAGRFADDSGSAVCSIITTAMRCDHFSFWTRRHPGGELRLSRIHARGGAA